MSIIRLSVLKDVVYAPDADGDIKLLEYDEDRRVGMMESLAAPKMAGTNSNLHHYLSHAVESAAAELMDGQPILIMVNGFLFDPKQAVSAKPEETDNPHGRLYHFHDGNEQEEQRHHTTSWPRWLGFDADDTTGATGLAIALGWQSQPGFATSLINHFQNFYARAYENAGQTAWVLVNVIDLIAELLPGRPIDLICHSLGSRVVVRAIALAAKHGRGDLIERLGQVIILGGAEYVVEAQLMQRRIEDLSPPSRPAFYNFVTRENDVLDKLAENFGPRTFGNSQVIGHNGLDVEGRFDDWIDLQIDREGLQEWMDERGFEISGDRPGNVWDHWYYYTFRGNMALYADLLRQRENWVIPELRVGDEDTRIPDGVPKRWWNFGD